MFDKQTGYKQNTSSATSRDKVNQGVFFLNKYLANKENSVSNYYIYYKWKVILSIRTDWTL